MSQPSVQARPGQIDFDIYYFIRKLLRNLPAIVMAAVIAAVGTYIFMDSRVGTSYSASMNIAVINRGSGNINSAAMEEYRIVSACSRVRSVLNSEMLRSQIQKKYGNLEGNLNTTQTENTNLLRMSASASTAQAAFRLLKAAVNEYPSLASNFGTNYKLVRMGELSVDNVFRSRRNPLRYAAMALLAIGAAGVGLVGYYCYMTTRLHSARQARRLIDVDSLGTLHYTRKARHQKALLITDKKTGMTYSEEIDRLGTRVAHAMEKEGLRTVLISSLYENEGKSTVAANLALNLSRRGRKVLLVDLDMRRPALSKIFDHKIQEGYGVSDSLEGKLTPEHLRIASRRAPNLSYAFQAKPVAGADKLLETQRFDEWLQQIGEGMDLVILDSPPTGIVHDTQLIAGHADASIFVVCYDLARAEEVNDMVDILEETGTRLLGFVFNMDRGFANTAAYGYGGKYGRYYYGYARRSHSGQDHGKEEA